MKKFSAGVSAVPLAAAMALLAVLFCPVAQAQNDVNATDTSLDVQNYRPGPGPGNYFGVAGSDITPHLQIGFGLDANYQHKPLLFKDSATDEESDAVAYQVTLDFLWALGIFDILQIGVALPVVVAQDGDGLAIIQEGETLSTTAIRDLRIQLKGRILGVGKGAIKTKVFGLAIALGLSVPTGDDDNFAGDSNVTADAPVIIFDWRNDLVKVGLNLGLRWRETSAVGTNFKLGHQFLYGLGLAVTPLKQRLIVLAEYEGMFGFEKLDETINRSPMEARLGIGAAVDKKKDLSILVGGGVGIGNAPTVPVFRILASIRYAPQNRDLDGDGILDKDDKCVDEKEDKDDFEDDDGCPDLDNDGDGIKDLMDECPNKAEDDDGYDDEDGCPEADNDEDGIPDEMDGCPDEPEDMDGFDDEDGCPEGDSDADGVADESDKCPTEKEDADGFEDDDGCPDPDNDGDGIPDDTDTCPDAAEDADGFEDEDGCPDDDNDGDGVPDSADKCPDEPETLNGVDDDDGCPDKGKSLVIMTKDELKITQKINFKKNSHEIKGKGSFKILDVVASILKMNADIKVEVQGHTDNTGTREHNLELSQKRAESVVAYLVEKGVEAERLEAKGYGPDAPIADNATPEGQEQNRRVEFKIK
jgi:OOP family OmpA-OmpF porin